MKLSGAFIKACIYTFCILSVHDGSAQPVRDSLLMSIGYKQSIESGILEQSRGLYIHLPDKFDAEKTYPLVLVLDAEAAFKSFAATTELMGWQELIPACIVIGIPNINRELDYAPVIEGIPESGRADLMIQFYREELFPYLESEFNTGRKILWGHSWLGSFSTYVMLTSPDLFDAYMSTSPTYRFISPRFESPGLFDAIGDKSLMFYLSRGSEEPESEEARRFLEQLEEKSPGTLKWKFSLNQEKNHDSNSLSSYMEALEWFFGEWAE